MSSSQFNFLFKIRVLTDDVNRSAIRYDRLCFPILAYQYLASLKLTCKSLANQVDDWRDLTCTSMPGHTRLGCFINEPIRLAKVLSPAKVSDPLFIRSGAWSELFPKSGASRTACPGDQRGCLRLKKLKICQLKRRKIAVSWSIASNALRST